MKHLRKFEELDYSTYISAADKLAGYGQTKRAEELRAHAQTMSRKMADEETFGILVGEVRPFPSAKFSDLTIFRTSENSWCLRGIFKSGESTHRIDCNVSRDGQITWKEGNKFLDKKSVMKFQKVIIELSKSQDDFKDFFRLTGLTSDSLILVLRTFYA